jgi:hypothetical protein
MASHNRHRGGRQRGESKEQVFFICPICHQQVSKRKSRQVEKDGEMVRMCKRHPFMKKP